MKNFLTAVLLMLSIASAWAQDISVSTNILDYANFGTLNADLSLGVSRHWTVCTGGKYNPFTFAGGEKQVQNRQRGLNAGVRYWPWHIYSGWWISTRAQWQEFNSGGILSEETTEGDRYGGGVSMGYSHMLSSHLNLDFGAGIWGGYERYTAYACPSCGRITETGDKYFVLPNDILVALTFIF